MEFEARLHGSGKGEMPYIYPPSLACVNLLRFAMGYFASQPRPVFSNKWFASSKLKIAIANATLIAGTLLSSTEVVGQAG